MIRLRQLINEELTVLLAEEDYKSLVRQTMDIIGIDDITDLDSDEEKKKFFSYLDTLWDKENDKVLHKPDKEELKKIFPDLLD